MRDLALCEPLQGRVSVRLSEKQVRNGWLAVLIWARLHFSGWHDLLDKTRSFAAEREPVFSIICAC